MIMNSSMMVIVLLYFLGVQSFVGSSPTTNSTSLDARIVGGKPGNIRDYVYLVAMLQNGRHVCGASILSTQFVLTAAHCTYRVSALQIQFRAGSTARSAGGQIVNSTAIYQHPKYNAETIDYDVSIVKVYPEFTFGSNIGRISIATNQPQEGGLATTSGWGVTRENSQKAPRNLRFVQVPIVSKVVCNNLYGSRGIEITDRMICAGFRNGRKDSCSGDSGGPLTLEGKLIGVVSWGYGCARKSSPGVYTNLNNTEIRSFINKIAAV